MIRPSGSGWRWSLVLSLAVGSPLGFRRPMSLPCSCWQSLSRSSSGRLMDPMVPFLLLVAAMQGGILLRVPLRGAPIETLAPIFGGWVLIAVLLDRRERSRIRPNSTAGSLLPGSLTALAAIVGLTIAAQAWRLDGRMLNLTEILTLVQLGVLVLISAYLLRTPRAVLWMVYVTIVAGALTSIVALLELAGLVSTGEEVVYFEGYTRVSGLLTDPNFFSFQLLVSLAFSLYLAVATQSRLKRLVYWIATAVLLAGIVSSYSAGALVGVAAIVVTVLVLQLRIPGGRVLVAFVPMVIVAVAVALIAPAGYGEAITGKYSQIPNSSLEQLGTKRGAAWEAGVREVVSNPFAGVGLSTQNLDSAIAKHYTLRTSERISSHNMYIGMAVGTGVVGLVAFVVALASCFSVLWTSYSRTAGREQAEAALAIGCVLTAMVVVVIQGLQLDLQLNKYVWLLIGACPAIRRWDLEWEDSRL